MTFVWTGMLWLLAVIPALLGIYLLRSRRRAAASAQFGIARDSSGARIGARRHIPALLYLVALAALLIGLARPQAVVSLPRLEGTVILAFDVSGSMAAEDLLPSRMDAAKAAAQEFAQSQPASTLIGVVAFSDGGFSVQSPTRDREAVLSAISQLTTQRGTSLANGILSSLNVISPESVADPFQEPTPTPAPTPTPLPAGTYAPAIIVLLTDGENNLSPDPLAAAQLAADRGVRIYTIGIGSPEGSDLLIDGLTIHTRLDEPMLRQIADLTEGAYFHARSEEDLQAIYEGLNPQLVVKTEEVEVTALFAGTGALLLLAGGFLSLQWFGRVP